MTDHFTPLDIETGSADDLYRLPPTRDYVRLTGVGSDTWTWPQFATRTPYVTVNGSYFDFPALDRHCGIPVETTIPFSRDLRCAAFQHDPPTSYQTKSGPGFKSYSMAALAQRYLGEPEAKSDMLKVLAKEYGGYDRIPLDDERYHAYLLQDLDITRRLNAAIPWDPYEEREAWVSAITARTTLNGFRVDVDALKERVQLLADKSADGRMRLAEDYGFPMYTADGKSVARAPQRTKEGKAAFEAALTATRFPLDRWPRGKDGSLSLNKDVMAFALEHATEHVPRARDIIAAVAEMNGVRNNAANMLRCVTGDRVHPQFLPFQSTKRWSVFEPGLTVTKKGVEDSERAFLVPEPDHVLVSIDLDQIDIRAVAAHSQDPALIALLNDPARDIHTEISRMSGVPRKPAKTLDLGWLYARSANAMSQMPGMTRENAHKVCDYMSTAFPRVVQYQRETRERGAYGVLLDNGFGGRLRVDPDRAYTQSVAMIGQSTTRELIAEGLLDLARTAPEMLPMLRVIVHDEIVLSVPRDSAEECARIAQRCMSRMWAPAGASMPVAITAGQGKPFVFGGNWAQLYED